MALPPLRQELDLLPGPTLPDGQPSWNLHDPVRNLFFRIDWPSLEILQRWDMGDASRIAQDIEAQTTLSMDAQDVEVLLQFLTQNQLIQAAGVTSAAKMAERLSQIQGTPLKWLLHHYLFFRIPLVKPDAWLTRWLPVARTLGGVTFRWLTALVFLLGGVQVARNWDVFRASLLDTLSLEGAVAYALALFFVKLMHELGHAFVAKHHGCRVPAMGVAFLVMWPMPYTDTNETWRLTQHRKRMGVAMAGIATELVIAVWATLAWSFLPDGAVKSAAFFLATTSWVATLAINASPFMRFDGYFILSDALDMPNLHSRSFDLARWKLREWLFGLNDPAPEVFSQVKTRLMIAFAWATWVYRLVLFLGIAVLVYFFFFKLLGLLLFAVEILWFIVYPIRSELRIWVKEWPRIKQKQRSRSSLLLLILGVVVLSIPWPSRIGVKALLVPQQMMVVTAPAAARIEALNAKHGALLKAGERIVDMWVPELQARESILQSKLAQQIQASGVSGFNDELRKRWMVSDQTIVSLTSQLNEVRAEDSYFSPEAPFDGVFWMEDPDTHADQWIQAGERIGVLVNPQAAWRVETWLHEEDVRRVEQGQSAYFYSSVSGEKPIELRLLSIDQDASRQLVKSELATHHGGHISVRSSDGRLFPDRAIYRVTFAIVPQDASGLQQQAVGDLVIQAHWSSPMAHYARQVASVLVREVGF